MTAWHCIVCLWHYPPLLSQCVWLNMSGYWWYPALQFSDHIKHTLYLITLPYLCPADSVTCHLVCKILPVSDIVWCPHWPVPGVSPGSELTGAWSPPLTGLQLCRADQGGVASLPGYTLPAQLSVPGIATIASVATTMARVAADTGQRVMSHLSCYYPHQLTHKLQLRRTLLNSDSSWIDCVCATFCEITLSESASQPNKVVKLSDLSTINKQTIAKGV